VAKRKDVAEEDPRRVLSAFEERLTNLLAMLLVKDLEMQADKISLLSRAGFKTPEIAGLLGTTTNTVSVQVSNEKRKKKKK
jgi:hypothetical protein